MYEVPYFFSINVSGMFPSVTDAWRYRWAYGKRRIGKRKTSTIFFFFRLVVQKATDAWRIRWAYGARRRIGKHYSAGVAVSNFPQNNTTPPCRVFCFLFWDAKPRSKKQTAMQHRQIVSISLQKCVDLPRDEVETLATQELD